VTEIQHAESTLEAIEGILRPDSVVVVGASPSGSAFTTSPLKNLKRHGYQGRMYAVNPRYDNIDGTLCVPDIASLPEVPDTAVLLIGARRVPAILTECVDAGIKSATVVAGGFSELGGEGEKLEAEIKDLLANSGLRLVGPNTAGLFNVVDGYVPRASFNHPEHMKVGGLAIATQSGALCNTLLIRSLAHGQGLSYAVATGSQWDLNLWDFIEYFVADERTRSIITIIEGLKDPEKFLVAARHAANADKPVILLKAGRSELGGKVVETHSGALSGSAEVQISVMRENGVIVVDDLDELWETAQLFDRWPTPSRSDIRSMTSLGIATYSGGDGALAVDAAALVGLDCPEPSPNTAAAWQEAFEFATPANPFDYTGEVIAKPELVGPATAAMLDDPVYDMVLVTVPTWSTGLFKLIVVPAIDECVARPQRFAALSMWSASGTTEENEAIVLDSGVPLFDGSHRAVRAMARYSTYMANRQTWQSDPPLSVSSSSRRTSEGTVIQDYWESRLLLTEAGIPFNEARLCQGASDAVVAADGLGYPVTVKLTSSDIVHKAAVGAVKLYLRDASEVTEAVLSMLAASPNAKIVVESFAPSVAMALVGGHRDPEFGPVVVVGLGGIYAESYHDVAHVRCPATAETLRRALSTTVFGEMLGEGSSRLRELSEIASRTTTWFADHDNVQGFDINPLLLGLDGRIVAVDARVELA
jgi:acetate---CoA ligase (ADP-forming)